jgi:hypothetical protein
MSGPIVRKYGFPNHDKIFGARPLEHGVDEGDNPEAEPGKASADKPKKKAPAKAKSAKPKK